jgi:hypothetical protein
MIMKGKGGSMVGHCLNLSAWLRRGFILGFLGVVLIALGGCELLKKPLILRVKPDKGIPGTEVVVEGSNLGDPVQDSEPPRFYLGEQTLCFDPQNPTCSILEWTPTRIRWVVPFFSPGKYPLYIVTDKGESNRVSFEVLESQGAPVGAYVVGILDQGSEAVQFLRLQVENGEIQVVPWNPPTAEVTEAESVPTYSLSLSHPGMKTDLEDLLLRPNGESYVLISATPTDPALSDGIHGFYHYSQNFTTPQGFVTTSTFPRLFLPFEPKGTPLSQPRFGVYSEGGEVLTFFEGTPQGIRTAGEFSLLFLGLDFSPMGFFPVVLPPLPSPSLILSGQYSSTGTGVIHWLVPELTPDRIPLSLAVTATIEVGSVQPITPVLYPSGETLYVLLRRESHSAIASYHVDPTSTTFQWLGELTLPSGWRVDDLSAQPSGVWALVGETGGSDSGLLLFLEPSLFPRGTTNYSQWKDAVSTPTSPAPVTPWAEIPITAPQAFQFIPSPQKGFILLANRQGDLFLYPQSPPYTDNLRLLLPRIAREPRKIRWVPLR